MTDNGQEHKGLPVQGYKPQSDENVQFVNRNKKIEELVLKIIDAHVSKSNTIDQRWVSIAKTHVEQSFMALNRAVFRPERAKLLVGDKFVIDSIEIEVKALTEELK